MSQVLQKIQRLRWRRLQHCNTAIPFSSPTSPQAHRVRFQIRRIITRRPTESITRVSTTAVAAFCIVYPGADGITRRAGHNRKYVQLYSKLGSRQPGRIVARLVGFPTARHPFPSRMMSSSTLIGTGFWRPACLRTNNVIRCQVDGHCPLSPDVMGAQAGLYRAAWAVRASVKPSL